MSIYGHRRGSIFWALTLIGVGGLFLYQNINPAIRAWQIIGKFWPVLIIFWGLSKLIDYLRASAHPETVAPPLFSASEVILLVLVLILGTVISKVALRSHWPAPIGINVDDDDFAGLFLDSYTYTQSLTQAVPAQPHLLLVNRWGDIEVRGGDQSNFEAVVKKTLRADNEESAKKLSDQLKFEFVEQAGRWIFQSNLDSLPEGARSVRLDIVLRVPKGTSAEITAERGDVALSGLKGDQSLTVNRGDARVSDVEGLLRVHKSGGSIEVREIKGNVEIEGRGRDIEVGGITGAVTVNGDFSGDVQFRDIAQTLRFTSSRTELTTQRLSGRLSMEVGSLDASGVDGPFELSTRQKDVTLDGFKHSVKISDTNGEIHLNAAAAPTQPIEIDLKKGGIELALPAHSNFQMDAVSRHGEVDCDFPDLKVNREGDAPSISGSHGKGGPTIRLSTAYGTIRVTRQGALAAPPAPPHPSAPPAPKAPAGEKTASGKFHRHRYAAPSEPVAALWTNLKEALLLRIDNDPDTWPWTCRRP